MTANSDASDRYLPDDWTLPQITESNRSFFTSGQLMVQVCGACGGAQHPPLDLCHRCQSFDLGWKASAGTGSISSFTIVHRAADDRLEARVPYNVIVVTLDDYPDVQVVGNVINADDGVDEVAIGARVEVTFARLPDPDTSEVLWLPQWRLVGPSAGVNTRVKDNQRKS